jgi:hypothetical protein
VVFEARRLRWVHAVILDDGHRARQGQAFHQFHRGIRLLAIVVSAGA